MLSVAFLFSLAVVGEAAKPNIVIIMADDLGFSDLGCYGSEIETPNLDKLAMQGLRFSQFYNTAKCHSSRVSLLSGLYCYQAGNSSLSRAATFAEVLGDAGYFTTMVGKWHLKNQPTDRGFERYFGHLSGATNFFRGDDTFQLNGKPWSDFGKDFYTTDANTNYAIRFIDEAIEKKQPFLTYVAYNAPHYPLQAPKEDVLKYKGRYQAGWDAMRRRRFATQLEMGLVGAKTKLSDRPDYIPAWEKLTDDEKQWEQDRMAVFAAMVDRVDQNIGKLVAHLKKRGVYDDTLILFLSDNGACPFERTRGKSLKPWDPNSYWCYDVGWAHVGNTPFRWYKQNQHEGGISSPLIVHWPNGLKVQPGTITHQPGHLIDVMATCVDVASAKYPSSVNGHEVTPLQGQSLLPIFQGKQRPAPEFLYFQFTNNRAIRVGDWKLVSARGGKWELYNIADDRSETNDLAAKKPEVVQRLQQMWHRVASDVDRAPQRARGGTADTVKTFPAGLITQRAAGPKAQRKQKKSKQKQSKRGKKKSKKQ